MVRTKDKLEFIFAMARHSNASLNDCIRIMRLATTLQSLAETACNRELTEFETRKQKRVTNSLVAIASARLGCIVKCHGDPRGCVVKLQVPDGYTNDWGSEGVCVPA